MLFKLQKDLEDCSRDGVLAPAALAAGLLNALERFGNAEERESVVRRCRTRRCR